MATDIIARGMAANAKKSVTELGNKVESEKWIGTKAEWEAVDKSTIKDGTIVYITDDKTVILYDKAEMEKIAAQVAEDRTAAETAAQTAQAVADSLPDDYTTAVEKIAENTAEINNTNTEVSELKEDLISLLYEILDYQLEIGVNRYINDSGSLLSSTDTHRASTPPFDFEYKKAFITKLKYPVKLYGFDDTRWYVIYDSGIDNCNFIDTENYTKLFIQILAKAEIPSTETELFKLYGVYPSVDNLINKHEVALNTGSIPFYYLGKWEIGGLTNGENAYAPYRVRSSDFMVFSVDTKVYIEEGRRLGVQFFNDDDTFKSDSGWQTKEYVIPKNTKFKCVISGSLTTDDNEYNITPDVRAFTNYISAQLDIFKRMDDIEKAAIKKSSVNAYPMKPTNTLIDFLQGENTYRMQGATIKGDVLYYSMTHNDTEATIYKHGILDNTPITSVTGNFGHAGDLTYNPNTNEIITLNASYSYTTLYILDADSLELKRTVRIDTTGWRVATIAYNPANKGYVFELAANGTWSDYKFAIADENFNILSEFSPIKNGYLLQGIECDGKFIYALYASPNIIIVYDINGNYRGHHKLSFNTESECIAKYDDTTFFVGEDGEKKIYKMVLSYEWE